MNSNRTSDSLLLEYPGETDLVTWNAHRDAGYTTYSVGIPPAWSAFFLDQGPPKWPLVNSAVLTAGGMARPAT